MDIYVNRLSELRETGIRNKNEEFLYLSLGSKYEEKNVEREEDAEF